MQDSSTMLMTFGPLILMMIVFYFLLIRPQKKKQNEIQSMRNNIKIGDDVITIGGIMGKVLLVKEDYVVIESSATKTRLDVMKWGIGSLASTKAE
ncbi:preprotein translocase subunit YajC [Peptoniphilus asaccharolyticus DSM 20463]|uniref:Preprotein translocase subunit YajC n=1 Tax=Peptoniphilus asaccharolyticus DSM 20463 TaxID=573058 RepID=A0A1W1USQ9_PEPAS|nr:preprotein translocase subunit YajC [Peptoniphilus asaccharolyticus]MBL7575133.1 preprotein translocase subunit YajC [Peptoniphilus asaccharolyticus]SMB84083.1 preprotein translocase subunit YajC [Peptoniphilus asaccharolyticus DSM 20463]